jgi:Aspartyl protease
MPTPSRRAFIVSATAFGVAALFDTKADALAPESKANVTAKPSLSVEGVFGLYLSANRPMIIIRSAGRMPIPVVFDTGTNGNAIDIKVAKALKLKRVKNHITKVVDGTTLKAFEAHDYVMPDISIGALHIGARNVTAYPYDLPDEVGIFGPKLFSGQLVYIDLAAKCVRIINKNAFTMPEKAPTPYLGEPGDGLPAIEISLPFLEGRQPPHPVIGTLDSGYNDTLSLPPDYIDKVRLIAPATIIGKATSITGTQDIFGGRIDGEVVIGTVRLTNPDVSFMGPVPNVGLEVMKEMRFLLDPQAEQGWVMSPITLSLSQMQPYLGLYGIRRIAIKNAKLVYQREGGPERMLTALGGDLFDLGESRDQILFERVDGQIAKLILLTSDNQTLPFERTASL